MTMVSVCIATYNGEKYIRQQIASILPQLEPDDEMIVSDNGSSDATVSIIKSIGDERIKILQYQQEKSIVGNFENALKESKGEYIFLADQDDVWKSNKVRISMKWLENYDCIVSDAEMVDENLNIINDSYFKIHGTRKGKLYNTIIKNGYMGCCMAFNRKVLNAALPFPKDIAMHDIWIGNIAAYKYRLKFIDEKLIMFRCHPDSNSFTGAVKSGYSPLRMLTFRWSTVYNLFKYILK